jgi:cysteine desulfurase
LEGEALLLYLDAYGVMCSVGSACASKTSQTSHVLKALGLSYEAAKGSVRFSLGKENTKQQIDYVMKYLPNIVVQLREVEKIK